jgi:tRNA pseudouridine13 synthase
LSLPLAHGEAPVRGRIRVEPEDFFVEEQLGFEPDGAGGHALLVVEKRGANTGWVAGQIARMAGVAARDVGYSGQKDRDALTRQAFTVPLNATAPVEPLTAIAGDGFRVLSAVRHGRKLRPGSHRANLFRIRVREIEGLRADLDARLAAIARLGVPNYFGPQRFGRDGSNLSRAREWAGSGVAPRERSQRAYALSAARSHLFNEVVAARVGRGDWNQLLEGEAAMLDGRRSFFHVAAVDATLRDRCEQMDIHPSGPLWGRGASPATGTARDLEIQALAAEGELQRLLEAERLDHERRALRLPVRGLEWTVDQDVLDLEFVLPRGTFATAVLHEIAEVGTPLDRDRDDSSQS